MSKLKSDSDICACGARMTGFTTLFCPACDQAAEAAKKTVEAAPANKMVFKYVGYDCTGELVGLVKISCGLKDYSLWTVRLTENRLGPCSEIKVWFPGFMIARASSVAHFDVESDLSSGGDTCFLAKYGYVIVDK